MKIINSILFILAIHTMPCFGQVSDNVSIHHYISHLNWQGIRQIDSSGFSKYKLNSEYFEKQFWNDSLFIKLDEKEHCIPGTLFIGEYTIKDSVHFIDFLDSIQIPHVTIENICGEYINRNQLPQLKKLTLSSNVYSFKLVSYVLYVVTDSGTVTFHLDKAEFPEPVRNCIMKGHTIAVDNVKVSTPHDGIRVIEGTYYFIKE